jgi:hypothetical protein
MSWYVRTEAWYSTNLTMSRAVNDADASDCVPIRPIRPATQAHIHTTRGLSHSLTSLRMQPPAPPPPFHLSLSLSPTPTNTPLVKIELEPSGHTRHVEYVGAPTPIRIIILCETQKKMRGDWLGAMRSRRCRCVCACVCVSCV